MLRILVEKRYNRHKLSIETKHYEILFGIIEDLGVYPEERILKVFDNVSELKSRISLVSEAISQRKTLRLYVDIGVLKEFLGRLGVDAEIIYDSGVYSYVLVLEPV